MSKRFNARKNQLERSKYDRWLLGVLGGIADYLDCSSTLVRVIWIVCGILFRKVWWLFVIVYILAGVLLPEED